MATLIPALGTCVSRMTAGERRVAERLEQKLDEDQDDDGIPLLHYISCRRDGETPLIIRLPTLRDEATKIADLLNADTIKVLTMHASKGLEFAVVALPGVGQMPAPGDDEQEEARLSYVAATRATQRLVITASGMGDSEDCWTCIDYSKEGMNATAKLQKQTTKRRFFDATHLSAGYTCTLC